MLSVLYIVRNEEGFITKSAQSVASIADEIIIIDTGSIDKTIHESRQIKKARVISYGWCHNFSKAKNFGIQQCKHDWILCLDADEKLDDKSANMIYSSISSAKSNVVGMSLFIVDHKDEWDSNLPGEHPFFQSPQIRLFRRNANIFYEGRVRESVLPSIEKMGGAIDVLEAKIHHFLWHGKGTEHGNLLINYYNKLGDNISPITSSVLSPSREIVSNIPKNKSKLAIVITAFNSLGVTKQCLSSLSKCSLNPNIIFVDNASNDGTVDFAQKFLGKKIIELKKNEGVSKARNIGAKEAMKCPSVEFICFLDNDCILTENCMEEMTSVLEENPGVFAVGPLTNNAPGSQDIKGQYVYLDESSVLKTLSGRNPRIIMTDSLSGFCLMVRTSALKNIGLFEEGFGLYGYEDIDFCERLKKADYHMFISNRSYVMHRGRTTINENRGIDWHKILQTSATLFFNKWKFSPQKHMEQNNVPLPLGSMGSVGLSQVKTPRITPRTSIVILTCNRLDMTRACIESIASNTKNFEIIAVDNGSKDGTTEYLSSKPYVKLIKNSNNIGIPKARNQGIRECSSNNIVIMDNDIEVKYGWIESLLESMDKNKSDIVGIEAWKINSDFEACKMCTDPSESFDYLGGACCLFKRKIFEEVGLLDEGFSPAYYEDVDICIRAKNKGFSLSWNNTNKIIHKQHATLIGCQKDFKYEEALSKSYQRFADKMKGKISFSPELIPNTSKKIKILYLGMKYDYGVKERGLSFEHDNFYASLLTYPRTLEINHFDFVEKSQTLGIPMMSDQLYKTVNETMPDVLFCVFFNNEHDPRKEILKKISQTTPSKTIGWFCDSHWRYENFDKPWSSYLDFCITTSSIAYEKYKRDGLGPKTIKSQWGFSPKYYYIPETVKDIDVSFVGQPHGDRKMVVEKIKKAGIDIKVFGNGWGNRISFDEMIKVFNRSKINLNLNNACDIKHKQIKGRNFEIPGCKGFLLTESAENLGDYFVFDKEIGIYRSEKDMIDRIKFYLSNQEIVTKIAEDGYKRTLKEHTYEKRFDAIFNRAGLL